MILAELFWKCSFPTFFTSPNAPEIIRLIHHANNCILRDIAISTRRRSIYSPKWNKWVSGWTLDALSLIWKKKMKTNKWRWNTFLLPPVPFPRNFRFFRSALRQKWLSCSIAPYSMRQNSFQFVESWAQSHNWMCVCVSFVREIS